MRSFVRRPGRTTPAQRRALDGLWPRYGVARQEVPLDVARLFGRGAPFVIDIGFGDGEALVTAAVNHPGIDYLGIEVHEPGIGHLLLLLEQAGASNVRVVNGDAADVLPQMLPDACADAVNVFFPDPWPKKRHHKRRLLQPAFLAEVARVLKASGLLHVATDWADYARHCSEVVPLEPGLAAVPAAALADDPLAFRAPTKFERRGLKLGHDVADLYYRKRG